MIPLDAINQMVTLMDYWNSEQGRADAVASAPPGYGALNFQRDMVDAIMMSEPYFVSREIWEVLKGSLDTFPDQRTQDAYWPSQAGFVLLDAPRGDQNRGDYNAQAWVWRERPATSPVTGVSLDDRGSPPIMQLHTYGDFGESHLFLLTQELKRLDDTQGWRTSNTPKVMDYNANSPDTWEEFQGIDVMDPDKTNLDPASSERSKRALRENFGLFLSFLSFIQQRVATIEEIPIPRSMRRRLESHPLGPQPLVRTIMLRRKAQRTTTGPQDEDGGRDVDWQVRWPVVGHWRNQWHGNGLPCGHCGRKDGQHWPKYIDPYIKGPDDKPFKARRVDLYNVSR